MDEVGALMFAGGDALERVDARLGAADVARIVRDGFGLDVQVAPLAGERDQNFRVMAAEGAFVLKVSNSAEPAAVTDLQTRLLLHVAEADPALPTPRIRPARDGSAQLAWRLDDGARVGVRLLTLLPGEPLRGVAATPALLRALGATLGRLDRALAPFRHPAEDHELLWDLSHADRLRPLLPAIDDTERRALAAAALDTFARDALPHFDALPAQVIHNDLNPHNVLVADGAITGVIDFGDAVRAPRVNDLAIAAAYQLGTGPDPLAPVLELAAGYAGANPLTGEEVAVLRPLILGRLAMGAIITAWRVELHPENRAYILRNAPATWRGLAALAALPEREAAGRIAAALEPAAA